MKITAWGLKNKTNNRIVVNSHDEFLLYPTRRIARYFKCVDEVVVKFEIKNAA